MSNQRTGSEETDTWLEQPGNLERWTKGPKEGGLTASQKRVLVSQFAGRAWARLCDTYNFEASAQRLGLLMTIVRSKGLEPASSLCEISHLAEGSQSRPSVHRMAPATSSSRSRASRRSTHLRTRTAGPRARRARTRLTSPTSST